MLLPDRLNESFKSCPGGSVFLAVHGGAGAFDHEVHESRVVFLADDEGIGISRFAGAQRGELIGKSVENGMILDFDVHFIRLVHSSKCCSESINSET